MGTYLADRNTDNIVQPLVALIIGKMEDGTYDLAATDGVGTPVAVPLEHDRRAVVSLDHWAEVRKKRSVIPSPRIVRTTETPGDTSFTAAFGEREMLLPLSADAD